MSNLSHISFRLPNVDKPYKMTLYATMDSADVFAENEWELYIFPEEDDQSEEGIVILDNPDKQEIANHLEKGESVLPFGSKPFPSSATSFRISLAGRTSGNSATVVYDHPVVNDIPHEGFCGWQFNRMLEGGRAVCFETEGIPFNPIVEVVSTHKYAVRQAAMFELKVDDGKLFACSFNFDEKDAASRYMKNRIISYVKSNKFVPKDTVTIEDINRFASTKLIKTAANTNLAFNPNDKTAVRKKK